METSLVAVFLHRLHVTNKSPSSRSAGRAPSPITSAPPWDYSANVCLKHPVLRGEIMAVLASPRGGGGLTNQNSQTQGLTNRATEREGRGD